MNSEAKVLETTSIRSRAIDYIELMKPELTGLSTLTTLCGFYLATNYTFNFWLFFHTAIGALLVGGGASAQPIYRTLVRCTDETNGTPAASVRTVTAA